MSHLLEPPPYRSEAWLEWRRHGLGASDLPAVFGVSRFTGEYELAMSKRGELEAFDGNAATRWGQRIEQVALDAYDELQSTVTTRGETWGHPGWPRLWASLDGRVGRVGVEVKATTRWRHELPDDVMVQVQAQAGIADLERVDVVRVSPYGEPEITEVHRDDDLIARLLDAGERWYERYVEGTDTPPLDGSRAARAYLDSLRGEETATATQVQALLARQLRTIRSDAKDLERMDKQLVQDLKASMAGYGTLEGEGFRITWRARKGIVRTDWRAVAAAYRAVIEGQLTGDVDLDALASIHTMVEKPGTQFRPTWQDEEEETDDD